MKIVFIRHGKTKGNTEKRYIGRTDEVLSEEGIDEVNRIWKKTVDADIVFVSPMKRCVETAKLIFTDLNEFITIQEWSEIDFGDFEGKNYLELKDNEDYQKWIDSNGIMSFLNGESRSNFINRCMEGFYKCIEICRKKSCERIYCVVHGGTIMAIMSSLTGKEYFDFQIDNAGCYEIEFDMKNGIIK